MRHCYAFACVAAVSFATSALAECLKPNVKGQSAEGQLTISNAEDAAGRSERPYILKLAANACLDADDVDEAVKSTRTIHVFTADEKLQPAFRRAVGKMVVVRGSPFAAQTAHHHAPIVMMVTEINAVAWLTPTAAVPAGAQQAAVVAPPAPGKATLIQDVAAVWRLKNNRGIALQWISWDNLGRLSVTEADGVIHLDGSQSERNGPRRLAISGDVVSIDQYNMTFKGSINIYNAPSSRKECLRNGVFNFRITGSRKYWRLQEMEACEGLTDYVDIFF
jgi:Domain of unknown function (DUF4431)